MWFDNQAEEAARFYTSIFKNSKIGRTLRYGGEAAKASGRPVGSVLTIEFELEGQKFTALNGGPQFEFNESVSFVVYCETQKEVDYFWEKLTANGGQKSECGWLKDKFGLSWQIVPVEFFELVSNGTQEQSDLVMAVLEESYAELAG